MPRGAWEGAARTWAPVNAWEDLGRHLPIPGDARRHRGHPQSSKHTGKNGAPGDALGNLTGGLPLSGVDIWPYT